MESVSRIRVFRVARGLTQTQLADKIRSYQKHVSRIECGVTAPLQQELEAIAAVLDVPVSALVGPEGKR